MKNNMRRILWLVCILGAGICIGFAASYYIRIQKNKKSIHGIEYNELKKEHGITISTVSILTENASLKMKRPKGEYITIEAPQMSADDVDYHREVSVEFASTLKSMIAKLREIVGNEVDLFDLVCHFGYGKPIVSKQERINKARELIKHLNPEQQKIMNLVIDLYKGTDFSNLKTIDIFGMPYFQQNGYSYKTAVKTLGGEAAYEAIILKIEKELYK